MLSDSLWREALDCFRLVLHLSLVALAPPALLRRALVRLQLDELFGDLVVVALREDPEDGEARLVHVDALAQREPAGGAAAGGQVLQLQDGYAHGPILSSEAVVLHAHLQLVALGTQLTAEHTREGEGELIN